MNPKPRILVFRMREIIYTLLLVSLAILLFVCLFLMFTGRASAPNTSAGNPGGQPTETQTGSSTQETAALPSARGSQSETAARNADTEARTASSSAASGAVYTPGIYTTPIYLNGVTVDVEVTVDKNHINSIRLVNLSKSVSAMYPLMTPSLEHITAQILQRQTLDGITSPQENRYTSQILLNAISDALTRAEM